MAPQPVPAQPQAHPQLEFADVVPLGTVASKRCLCAKEGGIRHSGSEVKDARFVFGDDARVSLMAQHLAEFPDAAGENLRVLGDAVGNLTVFAQHALVHYLSPLAPDRLVRGKPQDTTSDGMV